MPKRVVSSEQVELVPEYHWYDSEGVPPEACDVSVTFWPLSIFGALGVTAPATSAALTVTLTGLEVAVWEALSVTLSSNDQAPTVDRAPVEMDAGEVQADAVPRLL